MKTQLSTTPKKMRQRIKYFALLLLFITGTSYAQIFNNAALLEYTYPAFSFANPTNHAFTYTMSHIAYMNNLMPAPPPAVPPYTPAPPTVPLSDLTVHSWDDGAGISGFAYMSSATGVGSVIYSQGTVSYPQGVQGIELALTQDEMGFNMFINGTNAPWYIIVSYYNPTAVGGAGHFVDIYRWNRPMPWGPGGVTLLSTTRLSTIPVYTRISMDAHNTYGFCITWEDPFNTSPTWGINYVYGFMNATIPGVSLSPGYTLPGTQGQSHPDVAFTHTGSGLNLQFIYYNFIGPGAIGIVESTIPFVLGPPWPGAAPAPTVVDNNVVPYAGTALPDLKTRLDAPDHYTQDNWAYSYILPTFTACCTGSYDIFVRFMNYNAPNLGVPATYVLTNGSMGNIACDVAPSGVAYQNDWPVASFDQSSSELNVEWYTEYQNPVGFFAPNIGGYTGIQMSEAGALTSTLDYLQVADLGTGSNKQASNTPIIASSRQNDRTNYQFVEFSNETTAGRNIQTKDRPWTSASFKSNSSATNYWSSFYSTTAANNVAKQESSVTAYPNPFTDHVALSVSANLADKTLNVVVEDITGRIIGNYTAQGNSINASLGTLSNTLANGTYLIKVSCKENNFNQVIKIQKVGE